VKVIATVGDLVETPGATYSWTVDRTAPQASVFSGPAAQTNDTSAQFTFGSESGTTFTCSLDGAAFAPCATGRQYEGLGDGEHTFAVRATDLAGNVQTIPTTRTWTVDTVAPGVALASAPTGTSATPGGTAHFTTDDATASLQCRVDEEEWRTCFSPHQIPEQEDGDHEFFVRAIDRAGNRSEERSSAWTVDTEAPATEILAGPDPLTRASSAQFQFATVAPEAGVTFACRIDGGSWLPCQPGTTFTNLGQGVHSFTVRARDTAGNVDATPPSRTWRIDSVAPTLTFTEAPTLTRHAAATFDFSSSEDGSRFECSVDGEAWSGCASPFAADVAGDGPHELRVRAYDAADNLSLVQAKTWTLDTTAPKTTATFTRGPGIDAASFAFSATEATSHFECRLDDGAWKRCVTGHAVAGLDDGEHSFSVRATDLAGNVEPDPSVTIWTVDTMAPETTLTGGPSGLISSTQARFTFSSSRDGATFQCRIDGSAWSACVSPLVRTGLADGDHTFEVRSAVGSLAETTGVSRSWRVDTAAPDTYVVSGPSESTEDTEARFEFLAGERESAFECRLDGGAWRGCSSPSTFSKLAPGSHELAVRAVDEAGNTDASPALRTWTVVAKPVTAPAPDPTQSASKSCTFAGGDNCPAPTVKGTLRTSASGIAQTVLDAVAGRTELASAAFGLPSGLRIVFGPEARGAKIGTLTLRDAGGKSLGTHALRLPRKPGKGATVVLAAKDAKAAVVPGARPRIVVSGLRAGVTAVSVKLTGGARGVLHARKGCSAMKPGGVLVDRAGATKTLKGAASCTTSTQRKGSR
jgi:hypothetical protein